jgi:hypothetical protein
VPAPAPTELLAEDIRDLRESNHRIATRVDSLEAAVRDLGRDLGNFRADVASEIGGLRAELASEIGGLRAELASEIGGLRAEVGGLRSEVIEKLGAINTNLEKFQTRTETSLRFAGWAITILIPVVIGLIGGAFWVTWHAAKLDSRVERVESRLGKEPVATPAAGVH